MIKLTTSYNNEPVYVNPSHIISFATVTGRTTRGKTLVWVTSFESGSSDSFAVNETCEEILELIGESL